MKTMVNIALPKGRLGEKVYDLLKNVTTLANNCELPMAMGMTAFGSPSVRVDGLSIAGK